MVRGYFRFITNAHRSRFWRLVVGLLGLAGVGAVLLFVALLVLIPLTPGMGELEHLKVQQPTVVQSAGGEKIAEFGRLNREWAPLSAVDTSVVQALVTTEDHRFYEHPGVDWRRILGAVFHTLTGDVQGGSTLTMQLARNLFPQEVGQSFGPLRKLKEVVVSFKIERAYSKNEIIETYLNTVPFLYGAYGIERGAQMYFGKSAEALAPQEAATLVGMLRATAYYNPARHPERARWRRNVVLGQMKKYDALTAEAYAALKEKPLGVHFSLPPHRMASRAPHFTERVRERLIRWADERGYNVFTDGLTVHATLDLGLQQMAEAAVREQGAALQAVADVEWGRASAGPLWRSASAYQRAQGGTESFGYFWRERRALVGDFIRATRRYRQLAGSGASDAEALEELRADAAFLDSLKAVKTRLEVGFAAIEPDGAEVRAYVGSRDFGKDQYDHAGVARRQPGSTFKPFVYATALKEGFKPSDTLPDTPVEIRTASGETWTPQNASGEATGREISLSDGLAYSKNTITSRLVKEVGAGDVARTARQMGVRQSKLDEVPALALGTSGVTLLEMASAYATLARGGVYQAPVFISQIEGRDGQVLRAAAPEAERVLPEKVAAEITEMMRGVVDRGTGRGIRDTWGVRADVAGKTGTTQGGADGWFLLMHPQLVAGAWAGFNDPRVAFRSGFWGQGAHNALRVVGDFYRQALRRGALSPEPQLVPAPEEEEAGGRSLLAQAGDWLQGAAQSVGSAVAGAARSAGQAIAGAVQDWFSGEDEAPDRPPTAADPPSRRASDDAPPDEADVRTWNESADERRARMERYWEEVQQERAREAERQRERLEDYDEETQGAAPDSLPEAASPDTTRPPPDEDDRRVGW